MAQAINPTKPSGLGKGLSSLISSPSYDGSTKGYIPNLPVDYLSPNPHQPRMKIESDELIELADSIRDQGVIQPLIVTKRGDKDYVLIAGERRWRAAQLASVNTVPVVVKEASPREMLELAVIENVQRKDLNPIEEAVAFNQLWKRFKIRHTDIAKKVGLSRVAVVNKIRLLRLPDKIKQLVLDNVITEGHARALLGITDSNSLMAAADIVVKKKMAVHDTEELVRRITRGIRQERGRPRRLDNRTLELERRIAKSLKANTTIMKMKKGYKISIRYDTEKEVEEFYKRITT